MIANAVREYWNRPFFRNIAVVLGGAALAQVLTVAFSPIISRIYSPAAFGVLGSFMAVIALVGPIAGMTYPAAIVIPKNDNSAAALVWLSLIISSVFAILSLIAIAALGNLDPSTWLGSSQALLYLVPLVIIFEALFQVAQQWMIRERKYQLTANITLVQAAVNGLAKIGAGLIAPTSAILVTVSLLSVPLNASLLVAALNYHRSEAWPPTVSNASIRSVAQQFADFPLYRAPQSLINAMSQSAPLLLIAYYYGAAAAGFFALSNSVLAAPMQLLTKAVNDVFFPRLVDALHQRERTRGMLVRATTALAIASVVPLGVIAVVGPSLFSLIFGAKWLGAGEYSQWLSVFTFTTLILRPGLSAIPVLNLQGTYLIFEIASTLLKLASFALNFVILLTPLQSVALFSILGSLANLVFFGFIFVKANQFDHARHDTSSELDSLT